MNYKDIEKIIISHGWNITHCKGSHCQYKNHEKKGKVTIPFHNKDLPDIVVKSILSQAGINKEVTHD